MAGDIQGNKKGYKGLAGEGHVGRALDDRSDIDAGDGDIELEKTSLRMISRMSTVRTLPTVSRTVMRSRTSTVREVALVATSMRKRTLR